MGKNGVGCFIPEVYFSKSYVSNLFGSRTVYILNMNLKNNIWAKKNIFLKIVMQR